MIVSDTSPLHYLVLIGEIQAVRQLHGRITIPQAVHEELRHEKAPSVVRQWILSFPDWIDVQEVKVPFEAALMRLDPGEREVIALAQREMAEFVMLDDGEGRREARTRGLALTGTLGLLRDAGARGLTDFENALARLKLLTTPEFYLSAKVEAEIRRQHQELMRTRGPNR